MISGRRFVTKQALLLVFLLPLAVSGCSLFRGAKNPPQESPWFIGPQEVLWDATLEVISQRYQLKDVNRAKGTFESKPVESLSPFKGEGHRRTVVGSIDQEGNRYRVKLRVWVEKNVEIDQPLVSEEAKWKKKHADDTAARVLLAQIQRLLQESGVVSIVPGSTS